MCADQPPGAAIQTVDSLLRQSTWHLPQCSQQKGINASTDTERTVRTLHLKSKWPDLIHHLFEDHVPVVGPITLDGRHDEVADAVHGVRQLVQQVEAAGKHGVREVMQLLLLQGFGVLELLQALGFFLLLLLPGLAFLLLLSTSSFLEDKSIS